MAVDHILFNKAVWINYDSQNGTVNINGKSRSTGVSKYPLGQRVRFKLNDPDNSISYGDEGTIIGSLGFIAKPDISDSQMNSCLKDKVDADTNNRILVKLDKGKIVYVPGNWADLYWKGEQNGKYSN